MKTTNYIRRVQLGIVEADIHILEIGEGLTNTLGVTFGVHGNEITNIFLVKNILDYLSNTCKVIGKIKIIYFVNPFGVIFNQRNNPLDNFDLNRGLILNENIITRHILDVIISELSGVDYYIDIHEYNMFSLTEVLNVNSQVQSTKVMKKTMIESLNPDILVNLPIRYKVSLAGYMDIKKNVPSIALEIPSHEYISDEQKDRYIEGMLVLFYNLNIIESYSDDNISNNRILKTIDEMDSVLSSQSGFFEALRKPGVYIKKGELIGKLYSFDFQNYCCIYSLNEGLLLNVMDNLFVMKGQLIARIGR